MQNSDEILTKLTSIEKNMSKQSEVLEQLSTTEIGKWAIGTVLLFIIFAIIFIILQTKHHRRHNTLQFLEKKSWDMFSVGIVNSLLVTGILMVYLAVIFLDPYFDTKFVTIYILIGTTCIGVGVSMGTFVSSRIDANISNEKMKLFLRKISMDDISNLQKVSNRISHLLTTKIQGNTKKDIVKIKEEIDKILENNR